MNFSTEQIELGKKLVKWAVNQGENKDIVRKEIAGLLLRHPIESIIWATRQSQVKSLRVLKETLEMRKKRLANLMLHS